MKNAFTLVELAIVLVILGLLVGGVLAGQNLIRAAELRSVTTDFSNYQTAVMAFREKYFALPGDMNNATAFWGAADTSGAGGACGAPFADTGTDTDTCDGDGNGQIGQEAANGQRYEQLRIWQHLSNAGMIDASYTGVQGASGAEDYDAGINTPESKLQGVGFQMQWRATQSFGAGGWYFEGTYNNSMQVGEKVSASAGYYAPAFTPEEMWGIDTKLDDGQPGLGSIVSFDQDAFTDDCTTTNVASTAGYDLASTEKKCTLIFKDIF